MILCCSVCHYIYIYKWVSPKKVLRAPGYSYSVHDLGRLQHDPRTVNKIRGIYIYILISINTRNIYIYIYNNRHKYEEYIYIYIIIGINTRNIYIYIIIGINNNSFLQLLYKKHQIKNNCTLCVCACVYICKELLNLSP